MFLKYWGYNSINLGITSVFVAPNNWFLNGEKEMNELKKQPWMMLMNLRTVSGWCWCTKDDSQSEQCLMSHDPEISDVSF